MEAGLRWFVFEAYGLNLEGISGAMEDWGVWFPGKVNVSRWLG